MTCYTKTQKHELRSLGLSDEQIAQCEDILQTTPEKMDIASVNKAAKLLKQVSALLSSIEAKDPRFYNEIVGVLSDRTSWQPDTLDTMSQTFKDVVEHQNGIHILETNLHTGESRVRAVTPKSKNFYRYQKLTDQWSLWQKPLNSNADSEFINFLTICLEGRYTIDGANRIRTHYLRYYVGKILDKEAEKKHLDLLETTLVLKKTPGQPKKVLTAKTHLPDPSNLTEDIRALITKRS